MDIERPHRTTTRSTPTTKTSELFICFTSRLTNSSSMRLSSRSILSPGRNVGGGDRSSSAALTTSLSRRLRRNGSLRGGAHSPALFPSTTTTTRKSRGSSAFADNPEPSSPKVTCIGQVRVKTKKQGKKIKFRACGSKRIGAGEATPQDGGASLSHRNQRWVHLPLTICETIKGLGNEFSCLVPCKSSCFSSNNNHYKYNNNGIELVVGGDEGEIGRVMERECSRRRSIFDDMEFDDLFNNVKNDGGIGIDNVNDVGKVGDEGDRVSVSVCVPPKNALLLMRCRSDPIRMASLSKKFLESPIVVDYGVVDEDDVVEVKEDDVVEVKEESCIEVNEELEVSREEIIENEEGIDEEIVKLDEFEEGIDEKCEEESVKLDEFEAGVDEKCEDLEVVEQKVENLGVSSEELEQKEEKIEEMKVEEREEKGDIENREETEEEQSIEEKETKENREETEENQSIEGRETKENREETEEKQSTEISEEKDQVLQNVEEVQLIEGDNFANGCSIETFTVEEEVEESKNDEVLDETCKDRAMEVQEESNTEESYEVYINSSTCCTSWEESKEFDLKQEKIEVEKEMVEEEEARKSMEKEMNNPKILPDCLMLMMCEPKLSMEVSKETWVCRSDFVRWLPERHHVKKPKKMDGEDDKSSSSNKKTKPAAVAAQLPQQPEFHVDPQGIKPGRNSISFPAGGGSVASLIEQKLAKAGVGYEPLVLTRCKSAPMRSMAKFVHSELGCSMWGRENGRKLEPHRPAICGVGATGVGF